MALRRRTTALGRLGQGPGVSPAGAPGQLGAAGPEAPRSTHQQARPPRLSAARRLRARGAAASAARLCPGARARPPLCGRNGRALLPGSCAPADPGGGHVAAAEFSWRFTRLSIWGGSRAGPDCAWAAAPLAALIIDLLTRDWDRDWDRDRLAPVRFFVPLALCDFPRKAGD